MAFFAAIKITDANGNIIELADVSEDIKEIHKELKAIHTLLEEALEIKVDKEEL